MDGDNGRSKLPPPDQRRIIIPSKNEIPSGLRQPTGMPGITAATIDTSVPPVRAQVAFYVPPGISPEAAPHGVFWQTDKGGLALSPFPEPPLKFVTEEEEAELEEDGDLVSEHQAPNHIVDADT